MEMRYGPTCSRAHIWKMEELALGMLGILERRCKKRAAPTRTSSAIPSRIQDPASSVQHPPTSIHDVSISECHPAMLPCFHASHGDHVLELMLYSRPQSPHSKRRLPLPDHFALHFDFDFQFMPLLFDFCSRSLCSKLCPSTGANCALRKSLILFFGSGVLWAESRMIHIERTRTEFLLSH